MCLCVCCMKYVNSVITPDASVGEFEHEHGTDSSYCNCNNNRIRWGGNYYGEPIRSMSARPLHRLSGWQNKTKCEKNMVWTSGIIIIIVCIIRYYNIAWRGIRKLLHHFTVCVSETLLNLLYVCELWLLLWSYEGPFRSWSASALGNALPELKYFR